MINIRLWIIFLLTFFLPIHIVLAAPIGLIPNGEGVSKLYGDVDGRTNTISTVVITNSTYYGIHIGDGSGLTNLPGGTGSGITNVTWNESTTNNAYVIDKMLNITFKTNSGGGIATEYDPIFTNWLATNTYIQDTTNWVIGQGYATGAPLYSYTETDPLSLPKAYSNNIISLEGKTNYWNAKADTNWIIANYLSLTGGTVNGSITITNDLVVNDNITTPNLTVNNSLNITNNLNVGNVINATNSINTPLLNANIVNSYNSIANVGSFNDLTATNVTVNGNVTINNDIINVGGGTTNGLHWIHNGNTQSIFQIYCGTQQVNFVFNK